MDSPSRSVLSGGSIGPIRSHQMKEDGQKKRLSLTLVLDSDREVCFRHLGPGTL